MEACCQGGVIAPEALHHDGVLVGYNGDAGHDGDDGEDEENNGGDHAHTPVKRSFLREE